MEKHPFFQTGDRRQLYARDLDGPPDAPLVFIGEGEAPLLRERARAGRLVCPVPGCRNPLFITRGGKRRDHFAHRRGADLAGHAPERVHHVHAKNLIADWVATTLPEASVRIEARVESGQVADVYAEVGAHRYVFEIQYSALTPEAWLGRHRGYRELGVTDVWLFGHIPPNLRSAAGEERAVRLNELHRAAHEAGLPLLWINPNTQEVATARFELGEWTAPGTVELAIDALMTCALDEAGLVTPTLAAEREAERQRLVRERAEEERYERERALAEARAAERARREAEAEARSEVVRARAQERRTRALAMNEERWRKARAGLQSGLGGDLPDIVTADLDSDANLWIHPTHWHALLFTKLIQGCVGESFTHREAAAYVFQIQRNRDSRAVYYALNCYLVFLRDRRYIDFSGNTHWIGSEIRVLADVSQPPSPCPRIPAPTSSPAPARPEAAHWSPRDDDELDRYKRRNDYLWRTSRERLERMSGGLPDAVLELLPSDDAVNSHPQHWHAEVYRRWIVPGGSFLVREVAQGLEPAPCKSLADVTDALVDFLLHLVDAGIVSVNDPDAATYRGMR